jgi:hypothetical protein
MSDRPRRGMATFVAALMTLASATGLATASPASGLAATQRAGEARSVTGPWRIQGSPDITTPSGNLASVSCTAPNACTGVGSYVNTAGLFVTLAEEWNGTSWHKQPTPSPAGGSNLLFTGVSCASSRFCEAVGSYIVRNGAARVGLAEQWNGRTWAVQPLPAPGGSSADVEPAAVSCATATFCVAVGRYENSSSAYVPLAEVWNGTSWKPQTIAGPAGFQLNGVSCRSTTFCEAVGDSSPSGQNAEIWNGRSWSLQSTPAPPHSVGIALLAVSCVAANRCEAVGDWLAPGGELPRALTLAEVWNGTAWTTQPTPNLHALPNNDLAGVSCPSARSCTAVGSNFDPVSAASATLAEQWNGTSWSLQSTPRPRSATFMALNSVSCAAANACEAAGTLQQASEEALAESWNGRAWTIQRGVAPAGAANNFLSAVSCVTASFCAAVGNGMDPTGRNIGLAEVWNGATWKIQPTPDPAKLSNVRAFLNGVSCVSTRFCAAVGQSNSIPNLFTEVWNGTSWKILTAPGNGALASVSCPSVSFCAAVGGTAAVVGGSAEVDLWNGRSWSAGPSAPGFTSLTSVSCVSASYCEAVGPGSSGQDAEVWNGHSWSVQSTPLPAGVSQQNVNFNGVSCAAPNACEAVGGYSTGALQSATLAEVWDGKAWAIQPSPSPMPSNGPSLKAVSCTSPASCTAVGVIGNFGSGLTLAEAWDGRSWQVQPTPTPNVRAGGGALAGVWCATSLACTAVGFAYDAGATPATLIEARS